ncbi:MAG: sigma-E factor negative regulatory protein [Rudaea sp.]
MKEKISMLMDGELGERELDEALAALARDDEVMRVWRTYHLIRDVLHGEDVFTAEFSAGVAARLSQEPTVLAPRRVSHLPLRRRWMAMSVAASFAAVALVGWLAFAPRPGTDAGPVREQVAKAPVRVPLPRATDDYLLAHQAYSPRLTLQGVAPYVRTVSDEAVASDTQ